MDKKTVELLLKIKRLSNLDDCQSSEDMQYSLMKIEEFINSEYPNLEEITENSVEVYFAISHEGSDEERIAVRNMEFHEVRTQLISGNTLSVMRVENGYIYNWKDSSTFVRD